MINRYQITNFCDMYHGVWSLGPINGTLSQHSIQYAVKMTFVWINLKKIT